MSIFNKPLPTGPFVYDSKNLFNGYIKHSKIEILSDEKKYNIDNKSLKCDIKIVKEELNKMKYLLGYQRGMVISEQDAPAATAKDVIKQIQRILVDKYKVDLGKTGDKFDGVDGDWGNLTQSALEKVIATKNARKEQSQQATSDAKNVMPSTEITPGGQYGGAPSAATITTAPSAASAAAPVRETARQ